jgi:PEP-CTERM motif
MRCKKFELIGLTLVMLCLSAGSLVGQGTLVVDQASGTNDEIVLNGTQLPDNQIAQSFTPSLSAVGFVQFSVVVPANPGNDAVTFMVNLRQVAYNGPIISSTDPVVLVNHSIQIGTFYFPDNIPVTPGQLYFFEPVLLSAGFLDVGYKFPSSYPGGEAWNNGFPSGNASDYWFREGVVVPEPGTVWLVLVGGGALLWRWRIGRKS